MGESIRVVQEFLQALTTTDSGSLFWLSVLFAFVALLLTFWRLLRKLRFDHSTNSSGSDADSAVHSLFNRIAIRVGPRHPPKKEAFLRSLTSNRATILLAASDVHKGAAVEVDFSELCRERLREEGSRELRAVKGRIVRVQQLDRDDGVLINVSFSEKNAIPTQLLKRSVLRRQTLVTEGSAISQTS